MVFRLKLVIILFSIAACSTGPTPEQQEVATSGASEINAFFERVFQERLDRNPNYQSQLGIKTDYGKWTERTEKFFADELANDRRYLAELEKFDVLILSPQDTLSYRLFRFDLERRIGRYQWRHHAYSFEHRYGPQSYVPSFLINTHKISSEADARAYISRLHGVTTFFDQSIGRMRLSAARGIVPPRLVFPIAIENANNVITGRPFDDSDDDSALRADFKKKIAAIDVDAATRSALLVEADEALVKSTGPAYRKLIDHIRLLQRRAPDNHGVWNLPQGAEFYEFELRRHTTTSMDATEIHDLGLAEVERIQAEIRTSMDELGFDGSLQEFFSFLRSDSQFYYPDSDAGRERYLADAVAAIDGMRSRLDELFVLKPRAELLVKRVEPFRERSAGRAFYQRPAADGSRPGIYYANLYKLKDMPKYQLKALAYHEGIPGHHMQIAIQQELTNLPRFRRFARFTIFSEGWGLYSEWLPTEIDAYADAYSNIGRLAAELWRACRLVVDTGLHAKRWSREEAIAYLVENAPNAATDAEKAIDRYLVRPGQATAYKIGMLRIQALRARAESELGEHFDVRLFHDAVLENGPMPMSLLDEMIERFIENQKNNL